jgi:hypothetical protein
MEPLTANASRGLSAGSDRAERRVRAFRATDAFVVETYRVATSLEGTAGRDLAGAIRTIVVDCGGALVAASESRSGERRWLSMAHEKLAEARYCLYLARRLGMIDLTRYRALTGRHDAATRELDLALEEHEVSPQPP